MRKLLVLQSMYNLHLIRSSGGTGRGEVIIIIREVVTLARTALALATQACNGGKVRRVRARAAAGAARGAVGRDLTSAQGHQGSRVNTVGRSVGTTGGTGRVRAAVGVLSHRSGKVQTWEAETGEC